MEKHDPIVDKLADANKPPQPAVTDFETNRNWTVPFSTGKYPNSRYSLVSIKPLTGRKHQIRRHFNHMAYPIIGDTTYGDRRHNRLFLEQFNSHRLLLVAESLKFVHPKTGIQQTIKANVGLEFESAIRALDQNTINI